MSVISIDELLGPNSPVCLVVKASLEPVGGVDRFQPAGFPEIGHVVYDAPRPNGAEKVCIVDSAASMANHLESVCMRGANDPEVVPDLEGLPYVACYTDRSHCVSAENGIVLDPGDPHDRLVATSLTEGHRIASDYFLDGLLDPAWATEIKGKKAKGVWAGTQFRTELRKQFEIEEVQRDKKYFLSPASWWTIYATLFAYDPNCLIHGVLFAKEQIKIGRILTGYLDAFGAAPVRRSGVKFDRLGKTTSGQPIFAVDEETARRIQATFVIDVGMLRSYGRDGQGLAPASKALLLELALWKIRQLVSGPFRYRSQCFLSCTSLEVTAGDRKAGALPDLNIQGRIRDCKFEKGVTSVYYPANELFKAGTGDTVEREQAEGEGES